MSSTIAPALVHQTDGGDVIPTGWSRAGEHGYRVKGNWNSRHAFFSPLQNRYSPVTIFETFRQSIILLAHEAYSVPMEHHFVMWDVYYTAVPQELAVREEAARIDVEVEFSDILQRGTRPAGMHCHIVISRGGRQLAAGGGRLSITSPAAYRRLRGEALHSHAATADLRPAIAPALVGRSDESYVVLGAADTPDSWGLRIDPLHPLNVNRKRDHHPGILLMEAVQQVAHLVPRQPFYPETLRIQFQRYAELGVPCVIEARTCVQLGTGTELLTVRGTQDGQLVFTADLHNAAALVPADAP